MKFFFDRCISSRLSHMMAVYLEGVHEVRHLDDDQRFKKDTEDTVWMQALAKDHLPWVVITRDLNITKNKVEREVLRSVPMKFFFLSKQWGKMQLHELVWKFFKVWPEIARTASTNEGKIFEISAGKNLSISRRA